MIRNGQQLTDVSLLTGHSQGMLGGLQGRRAASDEVYYATVPSLGTATASVAREVG